MKKRSTASEIFLLTILIILGLLFLITDVNAASCTPEETEACSSGLPGVCGTGERICDETGEWGNCLYPLPSPESANCNDNLDNDCDGATDFFDSDCQGSCEDGVHNQDEMCADVGGICTSITPYEAGYEESCLDFRDNDCDGLKDFDDPDCDDCSPGDPDQHCNTGLEDFCAFGIRTCEGTTYGVCIPLDTVVSEESISAQTCMDARDNDCDGHTDLEDSECIPCTPDATESCSINLLGICSTGTKTCNEDATWSSCLQDTQATIEICNDNLDNDCDGETDEISCSNYNPEETINPITTSPSIECSSGNSESCITGNPGICSSGTKTCNEEGFWEACIQDVALEKEICNDNLDNDCDGETDESDCEVEELIVTSPIDCEITSTRWSQDEFGQDYILRIESKGDCEDAEIEIKIYETDVLINDPIRTQLSTFNNGNGDLLISLSKEEVAKVASGFLEGNQFEVVFKAVVRYTDQKWIKSDVLQI